VCDFVPDRASPDVPIIRRLEDRIATLERRLDERG